MAYKPMMSEKERLIRQKWHEESYADLKRRKSTSMNYLGLKLIVTKNVFPPAPMSELLGKSVLKEVKETDRVLDMGTGSGVNAILAASKSHEVIGVDINIYAISCAKRNAKLNKVSSRTRFLKSDLFKKVEGKFDLIIFDPPFRWLAPRDILEASIADKHFRTLTAFFKQVKKHLKKNGRILIFYGDSGDLRYLKHLIRINKFQKRTLCKKTLIKNKRKWNYYVYKLKRSIKS